MSNETDFFLNTQASVILLETVVIAHPSFSKEYRIVRNNTYGITAKTEAGQDVQYEYYPLKIQRSGAFSNLDQSLKITVGDLGTIIPEEIERVRVAGTFNIKPTVTYRAYRSDDLSAPLFGPYILEVISMPQTNDGCAFEATAPVVNKTATGEEYTLERFTGLLGYL